MPKGKKKSGSETTLEDLNKLRCLVPRRMINDVEREHIVQATHELLLGSIARIDKFVRSRPGWQRLPNVEQSAHLFGLDRPDSSLMQPRLEWKMSLSERIATETLARLLNSGGAQVRAARIEAFLRALGLGDAELGIDSGCLASAQVFSEVPALDGRRIDLKLMWRDAQDRERVLVVEAKFEHVITKGQLECYKKTTQKQHGTAEKYFLVLALDETAMHLGSQSKNRVWRFCSWRDLWVRFEATRPVESNLNLQLFLHALWRRIGQLNPKDAHAAL